MIPSAHQLSIKLMQRCPSCAAAISNANIHVIHESDEALLAHLACARCLASYIAYIVANNQGILGNAILTDQSYGEILKSMEDEQLTEDEVLSLVTMVESQQLFPLLQKQSN